MISNKTTGIIVTEWAPETENFWLLHDFSTAWEQFIVESLCYSNLVIGILVRILMLRVTCQRQDGIKTVVGKLIVMDETVKLIGYSGIFAFVLVTSKMDGALVDFVGHTGCSLTYFGAAFTIFHTYTSGLSIAVMRFMLITNQN